MELDEFVKIVLSKIVSGAQEAMRPKVLVPLLYLPKSADRTISIIHAYLLRRALVYDCGFRYRRYS